MPRATERSVTGSPSWNRSMVAIGAFIAEFNIALLLMGADATVFSAEALFAILLTDALLATPPTDALLAILLTDGWFAMLRTLSLALMLTPPLPTLFTLPTLF